MTNTTQPLELKTTTAQGCLGLMTNTAQGFLEYQTLDLDSEFGFKALLPSYIAIFTNNQYMPRNAFVGVSWQLIVIFDQNPSGICDK